MRNPAIANEKVTRIIEINAVKIPIVTGLCLYASPSAAPVMPSIPLLDA